MTSKRTNWKRSRNLLTWGKPALATMTSTWPPTTFSSSSRSINPPWTVWSLPTTSQLHASQATPHQIWLRRRKLHSLGRGKTGSVSSTINRSSSKPWPTGNLRNNSIAHSAYLQTEGCRGTKIVSRGWMSCNLRRKRNEGLRNFMRSTRRLAQ